MQNYETSVITRYLRASKAKTLATLFFCLIIVNSANATSEEQCSMNIIQLGRDLQVMLDKIPIMPPIGEVYRPLKGLYDEALRAQRNGNYEQCITKTELALRHSRAYR